MIELDLLLILLSLTVVGLSLWAAVRMLREPAGGSFADVLNDGAVMLIDKGRIVRLAREARGLFGDVMGESATKVLGSFLGDDRGEAISALNRLERTGEPVRLLTADRSGRTFELAGKPEGGLVRVVLRDASLIEQRVEAVETRLREREAALDANSAESRTLAAIVARAPLIVWDRDADCRINWAGGAITVRGGTVTADAVTAMIANRLRLDPSQARPGGIEKSRVEVALPGEGATLPLHVVELPGPRGGVVGYAVDATLAASAERTLTRFVQTMTETFAHLTVGLAIFDRNQTLALFNPALVQMWQVDAAWLARRPSLREILETLRAARRIPEVHDFHGWRGGLLALFEDTERVDYEEIWHLADGSNIRVLARPHPHGSLAFVFDDVSERMELEQRFRHSIDLRRATLDRMDEGLAVFGPDGSLSFVNAAFHEIWGTDPEALGPATHAREIVGLCRAASVETDVWRRLMAFITADDTRRPFSTRLTLGSGQVLSVRVASLPDSSSLVVFSDITDSERIALALRERNEALEAAEEMRTAVLDQISHRLRTPLNTIFGFGQLISDPRFGELSERQRDYANGILEAAGQLLDTIDDVTELAALQIEPLHDEAAPQRVWEILEATRELLLKRAIESGVTLLTEEPPEGEEHLSCDLPNLRQIVFIMVADALLRAGRGGQIRLGARADGDTLEICTAESGSNGDGNGGAKPPPPELGGLARSMIRRMTAAAGGSFRLHEEDGESRACCRFPDVFAALDPELGSDVGAGATRPWAELDLPEDPESGQDDDD